MTSYLWIFDLPFEARFHNGGLVRYLNLSRELLQLGHSVTFAVVIQGDRQQAVAWLENLRNQGVFTNFCEIETQVRPWNNAASLLLPFGLQKLALRDYCREAYGLLHAILQRHPADVVLVSSIRFIYDIHTYPVPVIGDFADSRILFLWRGLKLLLNEFRLREAAQQAYTLFIVFFRELYASRKYNANIVGSPVDKQVFDVLNGSPEKNLLLANGVSMAVRNSPVEKVPNQIIFSGAMDFAPNYEGALWFLDEVFPLVLQSLPDTVFVIAGGNPHPKLLARAGANIKVTGFLEDLNAAIAQSAVYVAPMRTGSGFKNKVAEAIANGTWIIGTTLAVEFLPPEVRQLIPVCDQPADMARVLCSFLQDPADSASKLRQLRNILAENYSWPAKAKELEGIVQSLTARAGQL